MHDFKLYQFRRKYKYKCCCFIIKKKFYIFSLILFEKFRIKTLRISLFPSFSLLFFLFVFDNQEKFHIGEENISIEYNIVAKVFDTFNIILDSTICE